MRVSVVVCEHTLERYDDLKDAANSVLAQTYDDVELVLVADGNETVCERFHEEYGDREEVHIHCNEENVGLLESRNNGAEAATGDIVSFLDDDAIADGEWVAELVKVYKRQGVPAAGGKMVPEWIAGRPAFLPEEFYWLIGVTHRGFGPDGDREMPGEVRNTFGSNISFRAEVFDELGGFDTDIGGRKGDKNLQGGETELCARLRGQYGHGVWYNPEAEVAHKVFEYRTEFWWLIDRAFWQGYSKRAIESFVDDEGGEEIAFLDRLFTDFVPDRVKGLTTDPSVERSLQLVMLFVFTLFVGVGYFYGATKWR